MKLLDDVLVSGRESLIAEWLYSLGKGRQFKPGQHDELIAYLASVRPPEVQQQQQPVLIPSVAPINTESPLPQRRSASIASTKRNNRKQISPPKDSLVQSLDPSTAHSILGTRPPRPVSASDESSEQNGNTNETNLRRSASAAAASIRKPIYSRSTSSQQPKAKPLSSKLPVQTKKPTAASSLPSKQQQQEIQAAVTIQKIWRGYQTRNLNPQINQMKNQIRVNRSDDHLRHLNNERIPQQEKQIQLLQSQVRELQQSMQHVLEFINQQQNPPVPRPRTLQLTNKSAPEQQKPVETFAQGMANRLIKSVSDEVQS